MFLKGSKWPLRVGALLLAASLASPASARGIVIRSSGPARAVYPDGTALDDDATIVLTLGSQVTVVTTSGVRTLRGPGSFRIAQVNQQGLPPAWSTMPGMAAPAGEAKSARSSKPRTNVQYPTAPHKLWDVDVRASRYCVVKGANPSFWRPDSVGPRTLVVSSATSKSIVLNWSAGANLATWPNSEAPIDREQVLDFGAPDHRTLTLIPIERSDPGDLLTLSQNLLAAGCQSQIDLLAATADENIH